MKRIVTFLSLVVFLSVYGDNRAHAQSVEGGITYQTFYDELSPHGEWIDYPEYGYVWRPSLGGDFRPYSTNGRWVWTDDYEWMWVSDYSWGWGPFHYGRWFDDPLYGWLWMPGYEWAPAWVAWRDGGDYYGWAPLRPGIHISVGFAMNSYNPPIDYWCFTPRRYITSNRLYNYCLPRSRNVTIINNTTIINNYYRRGNNVFVTGPRRADAERYTGRIQPVRFRESNTPGSNRIRNNTVNIYRPQIQRNTDNRTIAPRTSERYDRNRQSIAAGDRNNTNRNTSREIVRNEGRSTNERTNRELNARDRSATNRNTTINNSNINRREPVRVSENRDSRINRSVETRNRPAVQRQEQRDVNRNTNVQPQQRQFERRSSDRSNTMQQERRASQNSRSVQERRSSPQVDRQVRQPRQIERSSNNGSGNTRSREIRRPSRGN